MKNTGSRFRRTEERAKRTEVLTVRFTETELGFLLWAVSQTGETASTFAWRAAVEKARELFAAKIALADDDVSEVGR